MRIPFRSELDEAFRSDRALWLKVIGAALVAVFVVNLTIFREDLGFEPSTGMLVVVSLGSALVGAVLGLALSLKDVVENRLNRGRRVHPLLRLYLGSRKKSLAAWFVTVLVVAFIVIIITAPL